jgi:acyl-CoA thioester hydrolase
MTTQPFTLELRVAWGEMDAFQHLNNVVYVCYMESARIAYFDALGVQLDIRQAGPILASQSINYRKPVLYPDTLRVAVTTTKLGNTSVVNAYRMTNAKGELVADGESTCVWFDYTVGAKVSLPEALREAVVRYEGTRL